MEVYVVKNPTCFSRWSVRRRPYRFDNCNLNGANFNGCKLEHIIIEFCTCNNTSFIGANLEHLDLFKCDFTDANFDNACVDFSHIALCEFNGASLQDTSIRSCHKKLIIEDAQIDKLKLSNTQLIASHPTWDNKRVTGYHQILVRTHDRDTYVEAIMLSSRKVFFRIEEYVNGKWSENHRI